MFRRQEFDAKVWREAERYSVCGDWYLYMQIANSGRIAYDPQAVSYFRQHGSNTSVRSFRRLAYYTDHYRVAQELRRLYGLSDDGLWRFYQRVREHFFRHFPNEDAPRLHRVFPLQKLLEERRRVRHIAIGILGFSTGGAEIFPIHLANELARRGHHVSLVVLESETENDEIRNMLQPGIPVYERLLIEDIGAERFFGTHGVDVMHTHYQGVDLWLHEVCKAGEIPYIVTLHGSHEAAGLARDVREQLGGRGSSLGLHSRQEPCLLRERSGAASCRDEATKCGSGSAERVPVRAPNPRSESRRPLVRSCLTRAQGKGMGRRSRSFEARTEKDGSPALSSILRGWR